VKAVSVAEMLELDRKTIEGFGLPSIVLMENAGREVARVAIEMLSKTSGRRIAVFCGTGNNGGDGFVAARHLARQGCEVRVYLLGKRSSLKKDPAVNLNILEKMHIKIEELADSLDLDADLFIDAVFGIGLKGDIKEPLRSIVADLNKKDRPILSIDIPSGLDADSGEVIGEAIKAEKTVTMQFPKKGFYINKGPACVGEVIVADIGII
jgi:NAD(P)H-hydrate epimerase